MSAGMFDPVSLRGLTLKNRIFKAATHDGASFDELRRSYVRLARNDVSLITVAYVAVSRKEKTFDNQQHIGPDNAAHWQALCSEVHAAGARLSAQLHHPGLFCMSSEGKPLGPSFFVLPSKWAWPQAMSLEDLSRVKQQYIEAAALCKDVGFDCVELHCGHGYLLSQFLTPLINRRSDDFGGSVERRARFPLDIIRSVREVLGEDFPIIAKMNADDGFAGGLRLQEALLTAELFAAAGVDAVVPSYGFTSLNGFGMLRGAVPMNKMAEALPGAARLIARAAGRWLVPTIEYESLFLRATTQRFVAALGGTRTRVIYVGGADSYRAIHAVLEDGCAAVQLGRPLIREPFFVRRLAAAEAAAGGEGGRENTDVDSKCIRCNLCTLASIDPARFAAGCPLLRPGEGRDFGEVEDACLPPARL